MKPSHWETLLNLGLKLDWRPLPLGNKGSIYDQLYAGVRYYGVKNKGLAETFDSYMATRDANLVPPLKDIAKTGIISHEFLSVLAMFQHQGAVIYRVANDFGFELEKASLRIKPEYLLMRDEVVCFEFPRAMKFELDDEHHANCVYVYFSNEIPSELKEREIWLSVHVYVPFYKKKDDQLVPYLSKSIRFNIYSHRTIEESLDELASNNFENIPSAMKLMSFVLKCLLYVSSGDPDLTDKMLSQKQQNSKRYKRVLQASKMILMGFNFQKTRLADGRIVVCGHPKWIPFGENRSKIKLIWVNPYERKAHNEKSARH